jgi:hypothetical protein
MLIPVSAAKAWYKHTRLSAVEKAKVTYRVELSSSQTSENI